MLVSVGSTDKFDNSTLAVDCSEQDFAEEVRPEEHVGQELSIRSIDQQHQWTTWSQRCGAIRQYLENVINETNEFENRSDKISHEQKMLAVKMLMLESLLKFRFRGGTTVEVRRASHFFGKHHYRQGIHSADNQTDDSEGSGEGDQRIMDFALQAGLQWNSKGNRRSGKGPRWKRWQDANR